MSILPDPRRLRLRSWAPVACLAVLLSVAAARVGPGDLEIHFIDVGQGHAALVVSPDGTTVLIDGGNPGDGNGVIVPYLDSLGISTIHYGVVTHYHSDHIGGIDEVFNAGFGPQFLSYDRGDFMIPSNGHVAGYLASVAGQRQTPNPGFTVFIGGGVSMEFVALNGDYPGGSVDPWAGAQGENASSVAVVIRHGDFDAWIGGDLTGGGNGTVDVESQVSGYVGQVEVALSNHHGSNTSSNSSHVNTLAPSFVVHSAGSDNPFGHPTKTVTNRWNSQAASRVQWSTTDGDTSNGSGGYMVADNHIVVTTDGDDFDVRRVGGSETVRFSTHEQLPPFAGPGELVISEVLADPSDSSDTYGEWFELVNVSGFERSLFGISVESGTDQFTLASSLIVAPGERCLFGVDGRESRNGEVFPSHGAPFEDFNLANGSSNLTLRSVAGQIIETVLWGAGGFAIDAGISDERIDLAQPPTVGNFANALSAWAGGDLGTPSEVNDNEVTGCGSATAYCVTAPNSVGPGATIGHTGSLDVATNDFVLTAAGAPASQFGIFYYGPATTQQAFGDGFRCVSGQTFRLPIISTTGSGTASYTMDFTSPPQAAGEVFPSSTWYFQFWYRDPSGPGGSGFNFTDGLDVTFCGP